MLERDMVGEEAGLGVMDVFGGDDVEVAEVVGVEVEGVVDKAVFRDGDVEMAVVVGVEVGNVVDRGDKLGEVEFEEGFREGLVLREGVSWGDEVGRVWAGEGNMRGHNRLEGGFRFGICRWRGIMGV